MPPIFPAPSTAKRLLKKSACIFFLQPGGCLKVNCVERKAGRTQVLACRVKFEDITQLLWTDGQAQLSALRDETSVGSYLDVVRPNRSSRAPANCTIALQSPAATQKCGKNKQERGRNETALRGRAEWQQPEQASERKRRDHRHRR